jgi:hypothetical protein
VLFWAVAKCDGREDFPRDPAQGSANPRRFRSEWNSKWHSVSFFGYERHELLRKTANQELAERVGFLGRDFAKANEMNGFALISRNRIDLASSDSCQRLRRFAGVCRFFYFNDTRNGTRREGHSEFAAMEAGRSRMRAAL